MRGVHEPRRGTVALRSLGEADLPLIRPWFEDPETRSFLGGPNWPAAMLEHSRRAVGTMFRGARQTAAHHYLALAAGVAAGYIDCGTFDRCTVFGGEGPDGPIIAETLEVVTGSIAFVIDPTLRGRGVGRAMITALFDEPDLLQVELFEAGVEPKNVASRRCLQAAGFKPASVEPDFEGMLYYRRWRRDHAESRAART